MKYDVIVVGAGHAGCEAALATSKNNLKTLLITSNINNIASLPCNPSIGGSAKGIVVREIDALGGIMGKIADETKLQIKLLNNGKGYAVQALRAQIDKIEYPKQMLKILNDQKNLTILENMVEDLIVDKEKVMGVITEKKEKIISEIVILTTGTYLKSDVLLGNTRKRSGPNSEKPSNYLSDKLQKYGFKILRLKTGTPPRIEKSSIDFSKARTETGDFEKRYFSFDNNKDYDVNNQIDCHLIYTNDNTKSIILDNLEKSSMYGGIEDLNSVGPRYCPSIEDKFVRFNDKEKHQLFLEQETIYNNDIYIQGFSTSLPIEIQEEMVKSLPGLENAKINKYAYAIEYDAIYPTQLKLSLETKVLENLYTAGQINGTSGYEEAACQGLIAGINASRKLKKLEPLILKRNEAYIGVLIDDLVTKGVKDPYRLLTSRAEYRLLLRSDNADLRLRRYGYENNLISDTIYANYIDKEKNIENLIEELKTKKLTTLHNEFLKNIGTTQIKDGITLYDLLKRPEIKIDDLEKIITKYKKEELEQAQIKIKYKGYIEKANKEAQKLIELENKLIPISINYDDIPNLASEARQKLSEIRPTSLGQATRISGVNPVDISLIAIYIKKGVK